VRGANVIADATAITAKGWIWSSVSAAACRIFGGFCSDCL
jgi:hypothetical protein